MLRFDARELVSLRQRIDAEFTFIPFFRALSIRPEQERYFMESGVDRARRLRATTVKARARRWGHYRASPREGVVNSRPYGVWTGNTLDHTTKKRARVSIRTGVMTLQHRLHRRIDEYWDAKALASYLGRAARLYFRDVFGARRRTPPRVITVRARAA